MKIIWNFYFVSELDRLIYEELLNITIRVSCEGTRVKLVDVNRLQASSLLLLEAT